jgi:hypothetical protein
MESGITITSTAMLIRQREWQDAEARAALANLRRIIFRGRVARAHILSGGVTDNLPLSLIIIRKDQPAGSD